MKVIHNIEVLRSELGERRSIALVPTMGNIHEGHLSLIRHAKKYADTVVCTVFVNQLQFNESTDFLNYPRWAPQSYKCRYCGYDCYQFKGKIHSKNDT